MSAADLGADAGVTIDAFLGGRVEAVQPSEGHHRAGLEAVLLGAAFDAAASGTAIDLGAGAGVAGFCLASRCLGINVVLVERDATAIACARAALGRPANAAFAERVKIVASDIRQRTGLEDGGANAVICNPPFHTPSSGTRSPASARARAHVLVEEGLDTWFRAAAALLRPRGTMVIIFHAAGLDSILAAARGRFGALDILPVAPRAGKPAHRIIVRGVKGSRAPLRLLPPLVLHPPAGNAFLPGVEAILRDGADLASVVEAWRREPGPPS